MMQKVLMITQKRTADLEGDGGERVEVAPKKAYSFQKLEKR